MSKSSIVVAIVAAAFTFGTAAGHAAQAGYKKEELTAEQKAEIRSRAERLQAERTKAEATKPADPAKKAGTPKHTSRATTPVKHVAKAVTPKPAVKQVTPKA